MLSTAYTYGAILAPFLLLGNRVEFCDVDMDTATLSPSDVSLRITPQIKAIISSDIFDIPTDSRALSQICDDTGTWYALRILIRTSSKKSKRKCGFRAVFNYGEGTAQPRSAEMCWLKRRFTSAWKD